jgi:hypothetical protein
LTARLILQPVAPVPVNTTFIVAGTFLLVPNFTYQNNNGPQRSLPVGGSMPTSLTGSFAFVHPPFTVPAIYNVSVTEATTGATATIPVTVTATSLAFESAWNCPPESS